MFRGTDAGAALPIAAICISARRQHSLDSGLLLAARYFIFHMKRFEMPIERQVILHDDFGGLREALGRQRMGAEVTVEPLDG